MRSEAQTRWEKGVDFEPGAGRGELCIAAARRARRCTVDGRERGSSRAGAAPRSPIARRTRARCSGSTSPEDEQRERLGRLGFAVECRLDGVAPVLAAARRAPRHRRRRGGRALPARGGARDAARAPGDVRPADPLPAACAGRSRTCSSAPGSTRRTRTRCSRSDPDPGRDRAAGAALLAAAAPAHDAAVGLVGAAHHNIDMGNTDVGLFEVAHVYLPVAERRCRTSAGASAGSCRATSSARRASSRRCSRRCRSSRCSSVAQVLAGSPVGAQVQAGWVAQHGLVALDGEWSAFELDLEELFEHVPERILYRDVITFPPLAPGSRVRRRRGGAGRRADRGGARGGGRRAARGAVPERLPRRPDPRGEEVGRVRGRVPVARAHAVGGGRCSASAAAIVEALAARFGAELRA